MNINLSQVSAILNRTEDEVLYIANTEKRLTSSFIPDDDMVYNDDGTVHFKDGKSEAEWWFDLEEVLAFKKQMDEGLVGEVERILEGK
jgi:hypothetical protein